MKGCPMEKIMTIYDEDQLYCKRLGFYLRENTKLPFQIYPLTTPDALLQFQKKKEADLLLLSEKNAKTLPFSPKSKKTFLLTEENDCAKSKGESSIYKYQSADRIMREILLKYGELSLLEGSGQGRAELFLVYSPLGRSGKTTLALSIAQILAKSRKTLFLSLSETAGAEKQCREKECLTEALYHFKENTLTPMVLNAITYERNEFSTILPARSPDDLQSLSSRELALFLDKLTEYCGASAVVIDTDSSVTRYLDCFSESKKVFLPTLPDRESHKKLSFFREYIKKNLSEEILEKFVECTVPFSGTAIAPSQEDEFHNKTFSSPSLKEYTESLLLRYIYEEEQKEKEQYRKMVL